MKVRKPAASGTFYAGTARELVAQIEWCYQHEVGPGEIPQVNASGERKIIALVAPHAGYVASGPVAAHAYKELASDGTPDTVVLIGPNHTGYGKPVSVWTEGAWETPLGKVAVNEEMARKILGGIIQPDETAHLYEHSLEVHLPWLQHLYQEITIVPITMMFQDIETAREVGKAISQAAGENTVIIASTDFTHYEPQSIAAEKDSFVIKAIIDLNEKQLYKQVESLNCTMCGFGPVASAIVAAKEKQAKETTLLKYATSGDTMGDFSRVVGYASISIKR
ncbi:MAG: AmmeMemoRadiSam system protein B [Dehalococcoidia bacterium]|nr:AmmeMemoRadiSam system protein B [Dehalococcoidia bacterium]